MHKVARKFNVGEKLSAHVPRCCGFRILQLCYLHIINSGIYKVISSWTQIRCEMLVVTFESSPHSITNYRHFMNATDQSMRVGIKEFRAIWSD